MYETREGGVTDQNLQTSRNSQFFIGRKNHNLIKNNKNIRLLLITVIPGRISCQTDSDSEKPKNRIYGTRSN